MVFGIKLIKQKILIILPDKLSIIQRNLLLVSLLSCISKKTYSTIYNPIEDTDQVMWNYWTVWPPKNYGYNQEYYPVNISPPQCVLTASSEFLLNDQWLASTSRIIEVVSTVMLRISLCNVSNQYFYTLKHTSLRKLCNGYTIFVELQGVDKNNPKVEGYNF